MKLKKITVIGDSSTDLFALLAALLIVFVTLVITGEVILRYFFSHPTIWVIEISEYCLLFITFLGMAWVLKEDWHVKVDLVLCRLDPKTQALLNAITSILGAIVSIILCWYGGRVSLDVFLRHYYQFAVLKIPYVYIISVIPLGSLLLLFQFLKRTHLFFGILRRAYREGSNSEKRP